MTLFATKLIPKYKDDKNQQNKVENGNCFPLYLPADTHCVPAIILHMENVVQKRKLQFLVFRPKQNI